MPDQPPQPISLADAITAVVDPYTLITVLAKLFQAPMQLPAKDLKAFQHPAEAAKFAFQGVYYAMRDLGLGDFLPYIPAMVAAFVVMIGGVLGELLLWLFENILPEIATAGLDYIDAFRKTIDPQVANVSVGVLNELLGTQYDVPDLPAGEDVDAHIARAGRIGKMFIDTITQEIAPGDDIESIDGQAGAAQFAGMIINFGVATALLGLAGELSSAGLFKDFRLIGEQVSSGLGLSKQMRIAIKPLMKTLVAVPFQWQLNREFHPQRFSAAEVVNPFAQTVMDHDTIVKDLELQGWSPDRSEQLIKLHQKRLSVDEVELLRRWGGMDDAFAAKYVADLGWPAEFVPMLLSLPELKRKDARILKLVDVLEENVVLGHMTVDEFVAYLGTLPLTKQEQDIIQATVTAKQRAPHKSLTLAEMQTAFAEGIINLDGLQALLEKRGYTGDEELILTTLTLLKFARLEEAKKVAQFAYDKKVAAAKAKNLPIPPAPAILSS